MFAEIYKYLKANGVDVYSIGQHKGLCEKPYVVIKERGVNEISGTSLVNDMVELLIYYPIGTYSKLSEYKTYIKNTMKLLKGTRRVIESTPTVIDDDKKAYMTSFTYRKIKTKEGA